MAEVAAGLEWHGQPPWALSPCLSPLPAAQAAKQSHSDKIQRGEAPAGVGAGLTGHWSSNVTASHLGRGKLCPQSLFSLSGPLSVSISLACLCPCLRFQADLSSEWLSVHSFLHLLLLLPHPLTSQPIPSCSPHALCTHTHTHLRQEMFLPRTCIKTYGEWLGPRPPMGL